MCLLAYGTVYAHTTSWMVFNYKIVIRFSFAAQPIGFISSIYMGFNICGQFA